MSKNEAQGMKLVVFLRELLCYFIGHLLFG